MCRDCLLVIRPKRGTTCLETGAFNTNFRGCKGCGKSPILPMSTRTGLKIKTEIDEEDGEETVTYDHLCPLCGHKIATHYYSFRVDEDARKQVYIMECLLCGQGVAECPFLDSDEDDDAQQHAESKADVAAAAAEYHANRQNILEAMACPPAKFAAASRRRDDADADGGDDSGSDWSD